MYWRVSYNYSISAPYGTALIILIFLFYMLRDQIISSAVFYMLSPQNQYNSYDKDISR